MPAAKSKLAHRVEDELPAYNGSKLSPILLVLFVLESLHHILVFEGRRMLDQDVPKVLAPVSLTFRECIDYADMRFDLFDCAHSNSIHAGELFTQVGSRAASANNVDALVIVVAIRGQVAFILHAKSVRTNIRNKEGHTDLSMSRRFRERDGLESSSPVSETQEIFCG